MTVSRVVNGSGSVRASTRERVEEAMRELAYIPNRAARSLVVNKLGVLALVIPDISNPFFPLLARGAEAAARAAGYTVILGNTDEQYEEEDAYLRTVCALRVDGVILAPSGRHSRHSLELLARQHIAVVLIDRDVDSVAHDIVRGESQRAAILLTKHLIHHGHRRIGLITGPADVSTARERERGFREAMREHELEVRREMVHHSAYTREGGHRAGATLLANTDRPTAIVTANNFLGFGLLDAAREANLRVPDDLAIVTFDDVEVTDSPFFTCAAQPAEAMGRTAVERLIARLEGDESPVRETVLHTELRIRRSCGCN
jgi:LacI family transcriptional regulator, galactose operon repressor